MSEDLNLRRILFESQLRSKPVNLNFVDIENQHNLLRSEVYASIASTAAEITSARDNFSNLTDNIRERKVHGNAIFEHDHVTQTTTPSMKLSVSAGTGLINGIGVDWTAASSATLSAPATAGFIRVDVVVANTDNSISVVAGTATTSPFFPSLATTQEQLAAIVLRDTTTSLRDGYEVFNILEKSTFYPDVIIATSGTLGEKNFNNLIISETRQVTGTAYCQGYNYITNLDNGGLDGTAQHEGTGGGSRITNSNDYRIKNASNLLLDGSGGSGSGSLVKRGEVKGRDGVNSLGGTGNPTGGFTIKAYSSYLYGTIAIDGGDGFTATTAINFTASGGNFGIGPSGGNGSDASNITLEVIDEIINNGFIDASGGEGADGSGASSGTTANIGGNGGAAGDGGLITTYSRTFTNNGTITVAGGSGGSGGSASGGADGNLAGSIGGFGTNGTQTNNLYDYTGGLKQDYANWMKRPLFKGIET